MTQTLSADHLRLFVKRIDRNAPQVALDLAKFYSITYEAARSVLSRAIISIDAGLRTLERAPRFEWRRTGGAANCEVGKSQVYFVLCPAAGMVKIGVTRDFAARFTNLCAGSPMPLQVLAVMPGDLLVEKDLHHNFRRLRSHGEWFRYEGALVAFIEEQRQETAA